MPQPSNPPQELLAAQQQARQALAAGDLRAAESALEAIARLRPGDPGAWLNLAGLRRQRGDLDAAMAAVRRALELEPRHFHALLMQATLLERVGNLRAAGPAYSVALFQAPPDDQLDPPTRQALAHGRAVADRHARDLGGHIRDHIASERDRCSGTEKRRLEAFIDTTLRVKPRYQQEPMEYYYPGLPPIWFHERAHFPWLEALEAATDAIRDDLLAIQREDNAGFAPYIQYEPHLPLDQWRELNHSPRWTAYHFFDRAEPIESRLQRAPAVREALKLLPQPRVRLRSPTALFSALKPGARIPPHTGVANFRLLVHLPLVIPPHCGFRVGAETREWRVGEAWVFDDTIEHEAWNGSDELRTILIADIWSPYLSPEERAAIAAVIAATDSFNGTQPRTDA
jgi:aspartyl/asparaginyl beta-hydroxylase (cupin superfamily)